MKTQIRIISGNPPFTGDNRFTKPGDDLVFATALRNRGHDATIIPADLALSFPGAIGGDVIVIGPLKEEFNGWLFKMLRVARPQKTAWDPGLAQLQIAEDVLRHGGVDEVHFCTVKAEQLCGKRGAAAAREIAKNASPVTRILVTGDSAAWAVRHGEPVVEVSAYHVEPGLDDDRTGRGSAFLAGYVAAHAEGASVVASMESGHLTSAAYIASGQDVDALPTRAELAELRKTLPLAQPSSSIPSWLARAATFLS